MDVAFLAKGADYIDPSRVKDRREVQWSRWSWVEEGVGRFNRGLRSEGDEDEGHSPNTKNKGVRSSAELWWLRGGFNGAK